MKPFQCNTPLVKHHLFYLTTTPNTATMMIVDNDNDFRDSTDSIHGLHASNDRLSHPISGIHISLCVTEDEIFAPITSNQIPTRLDTYDMHKLGSSRHSRCRSWSLFASLKNKNVGEIEVTFKKRLIQVLNSNIPGESHLNVSQLG